MVQQVDDPVVGMTECSACRNENPSDSQFCSNCGAKLSRNPDNAALVTLTDRVTELERKIAGDDHTHEWNWLLLDEVDRWRVFWGVFWRGLLVYLGFAVLFLISQGGFQ